MRVSELSRESMIRVVPYGIEKFQVFHDGLLLATFAGAEAANRHASGSYRKLTAAGVKVAPPCLYKEPAFQAA